MPGTYDDPYSNFGRLGSEMWRAIRLVVDTGLHAKGWTEDEAHAYFLANAAITDAQARSEVQRYIVMPGQATGYKIGMIRMQEMRRRAEDSPRRRLRHPRVPRRAARRRRHAAGTARPPRRSVDRVGAGHA